MSLRENVLNVLKGKKPSQIPWLGDLSYWIDALKIDGKLPERYQDRGIFQLHRDLGVGFYLQGYFPFKASYEGVQIQENLDGRIRKTTVQTPVGNLVSIEKYLPESYCWAVEEHYIKRWEDLKAYRYWVEHTHYEADYKEAADRYADIGDNGLVLCYLPKSPLMELVALQAGITNLTYIMLDAPDELDETFRVLGQKANEAARIALESPAECLMIPENLSSEVVGKKLFNRYMRPYEEYWNQEINKAGKFSFVHMDGTLKGLVREVASTGFNVLEALTPSPVGDIPLEELHTWTGEATIVWGGIPGLYFTDLISDADFDQFVIKQLEIMKSQPNFVLGVSDQVPPGARWERVGRVHQLVEQYGNL